jgi:hypothetical protein
MRGAFRVEQQFGARQTLRAKKKQRLAKAAVAAVVDKPATVQLRARIKGGGKGAGRSSANRVLSQALDARRSTKSLAPGVRAKIKLRFSRAARRGIRATLANGQPVKVVVTATATDKFGKASTAKTGFKLIG